MYSGQRKGVAGKNPGGSDSMSLVSKCEGQYDRIVTSLRRLTPKQLDVLQAVVDTLDSQNTEDVAPFQPQTEAQLFARIDHSLAQIDAGLYEDADDVVDELLAEIDA